MNPLRHVAIIMDGNGRWGIQNNKSRNYGHKQGLKTVDLIIKESVKQNIRYLTLFVFSTDNWKRPKSEIDYLFNILEQFLEKKINYLKDNNIKLLIIGKKSFSLKINKLLKYAENVTKKNTRLQINLALNYGSKCEIVDSIKSVLKQKKKINEINITKNLYTKNIPDPDIIIRTGNTKRLSNFLLWQASYSEIFFEKKLWPDFNTSDYLRIIKRFKSIKRNYGSL